jgi:hypothetical protein
MRQALKHAWMEASSLVFVLFTTPLRVYSRLVTMSTYIHPTIALVLISMSQLELDFRVLEAYPILPPDWKVYTQRLQVFYSSNIPEMLGKSPMFTFDLRHGKTENQCLIGVGHEPA